MNKRKIINDPVYGFITIPTELVFELISHPFFQRLRRIRQLGLAEMVYTGATHTRFQHALGAMHLMGEVIDVLRGKRNEISEEEKEAAQIAILLHDIGHGPFSHVLEHSFIKNVPHEYISLFYMEMLNREFDNKLSLAIEMFKGSYSRPFFNQLISSQLDIDRLDYLNRDSFFTGVVEGTIGVKRIVKMMCIKNEQLAIEEKGILSIENFLNARRIMYWQVYLHKTAIAAEVILKECLKISSELFIENQNFVLSENLKKVLSFNIKSETDINEKFINVFSDLDDFDIWYSMKLWKSSDNQHLKFLSNSFLNRNLFKIKFIDEHLISDYKIEIEKKLLRLGLESDATNHYIHQGIITNKAYVSDDLTINIAMKNGDIKSITEASDLPTIKALSNIVKKSYLSWVNPLYLH